MHSGPCPRWANTAGTLRGTVTDPSRAVLPGATVTLANETTKFTRETVTDDRGGFFFATVDPGDYRLTVTLAGFKTYAAAPLPIRARQGGPALTANFPASAP